MLSLPAIVHIILELCSVILLFILFRLNHNQHISGNYSKIMGMGFLAAAVSDIIHTILSAFPMFIEYWVPFTWASSRFALIVCFLLVSIGTRINSNIQNWKLGTLFSIIFIPTILLTMGSAIATEYQTFDFGFVYQNGVIRRPLDFGLMILWLLSAITLYSKRIYLFPPYTFTPFMFIGILLHATMAFGSSISLDVGFQIAHVFKLIEYSFLIILYKYLIKWAKET